MNVCQQQSQPFDKKVTLKILYTFDDVNTFLARSPKQLTAKIITLPSQPPHDGQQVGCIELRKCLDLLRVISPEKFQKDMDYSIYYKDIIESGEPYVGSGLMSKILTNTKRTNSLLITGRLCTNVINFYQRNNSLDTLDIKLRLSPIQIVDNSKKRRADNAEFPASNFANNNESNKTSSSPCLNSDDILEPAPNNSNRTNHIDQIQQPGYGNKKRTRKFSVSNSSSNMPQLASRTQSLPFVTENSLAHRITVSDMISTITEDAEIDANGEPISSRFSNLKKKSTKDCEFDQPTRAKKTMSFVDSVVKIGDNAVNKKLSLALPLNSAVCINCSSSNYPPYKFHSKGLFQNGNSGDLCAICNNHQIKGEMELLRERGQLGARGLLDGPYNGTRTTNPAKRMKKSKSANPNSSIIDNSSSPLFAASSSPLNLQTGFTSKSKRSRSKNTNNAIITNHKNTDNLLHNDNHNNNNTDGTGSGSKLVDGFTSNDLHELMQLETNFSQFNSDGGLGKPISSTMNKFFTAPNENSNGQYQLNSSSSSSSTPVNFQSNKNTPNDDFYSDINNMPINAIKLNTTLIKIDDDDKENFKPPQNTMPPPSTIFNDDTKINDENAKLNEFFSPSIRRIIESFHEEPSSPSKTTNDHHDWDIDFFDENNQMEMEDPDLNRLLNGDHHVDMEENKYEITPRDPGTGQNSDSPYKMSPTGVDLAKSKPATNISANTDVGTVRMDLNPTAIIEMSNDKSDNKISTNSSKKFTMPSSPIFSIHNDNDTSCEKTAETTTSLVNWDAVSSPVTDPLFSSK